MDKDYKDILYRDPPKSRKRPKMAIKDRAAQFAPFSAVVGHEAAAHETARLTEVRRDLDESEKAIINSQLQELEADMPTPYGVYVTFFCKDEKKEGGAYISGRFILKRIDPYKGVLVTVSGEEIPIVDISSISYPVD